MAVEIFIAWRWPRLSYCPACQSRYFKMTGREGRIEYRRCAQCDQTYKVPAAAKEIDTGGPFSVFIPL